MSTLSTQTTHSSNEDSISALLERIKRSMEAKPVDEKEQWRMEYEAHEAQEKLKYLERRYKLCGINERCRQYLFENFEVNDRNQKAYEAVKQYAEEFIKGKTAGGLYLCGEFGLGKTHLACALCNHLIINDLAYVTFDTMIGIAQRIRARFGKDGEESTLEELADVSLLIIDDLGKEKATTWSMEKLFYIIDQRYTRYKPVVITSNYSLQGLVNRLTIDGNEDVVSSIISRLQEMTKGILVTGEDWRKSHKVSENPITQFYKVR